MKKPIADQIRDFQSTREQKVTERDAIMEKSADTGETLDAEQTEKYDTLQAEIKAIDAHLVRLSDLEAENKRAARPVVGDNQHNASTSRGTNPVISIGADNREKGIGFARAVMAKMASFVEMRQGNFVSALDVAKAHWPSDQGLHRYLEDTMRMKTAVAGATTQASTYAGFLVYADNLPNEFIEFLRPQTIIGKFGTNGVPSLRRVPFNVRIPRGTGGFTGYWVGEGKGKPLSAATGDTVTLTYTKVAAIAVITQELARFSSPSAEAWVRDELAKAVIARIDTDFIDPAKAVSSYVNPASITNGLTALTSAGTSADNVRTDVQNLLEQYILNNLDPTDLVLIMPNTLAMVLSIMVNTLGQREFPNMTINGGSLLGIPVIASQYAASGASFGNMVIAVKANDVALADDGRVTVDVSGEASLEMADSLSGDASTGTGASVVSMFQTNSLAVRAEREIHWAKLRSTAVVYMDDVNWGAIGSPY
jgi:HK97 family phage major capsid protein